MYWETLCCSVGHDYLLMDINVCSSRAKVVDEYLENESTSCLERQSQVGGNYPKGIMVIAIIYYGWLPD
ncbi:hypothetical protein TNCT_164131 [Trichonephila clavata]|uniref:Uncharacterized protein n=1 Tax=Trichonephila clavata TaxID=2740835 RepID=A0A8X6LC89_TRICU|nr:hypothetical protein TNCT_164131 [Trichonephila clavata]